MKRAFLCIALAAAGAAAQDRLELREGLVMHPTRNLAYVMTPGGGIAAIDLATGKAIWTTTAAAKPLMLAGSRLLSQRQPATAEERDDLLLTVLNAQRNGAVIAHGQLDLPDAVHTAVTETPQGRLYVRADRTASTTARVTWVFVPAFLRGIPPTPAGDHVGETMDMDSPADNLGAIHVDLETAAMSVTPFLEAELVREPEWVIPESEVDARPETEYRSVDGKHILISKPVADDTVWNKYLWTIVDAQTRRKVGAIRTFVAFTPFLVRKKMLVFETTPYVNGNDVQPAKLRGFDLATGQERWAVAVREVEYRGQTAP